MKKQILIIILLLLVIIGFWFLGKQEDSKQNDLPKELEITKNIIKEENEEKIIFVSYPSLGIEEIDKEIKEYVDSEIESFKDLEYFSFNGAKYFLNIDYFSVMLNKNIISFKFDKSDYTGGAHGNHYVDCFTYNILEKNKLTLDDFFNNNYYLERISSYAIEDLLGYEYADEAWIKDGAGEKQENYEKFIVSENAFIFYFPPYQVAPYAAGEKQVILPFSEIKDYLSEDIFENHDFTLNKGIYVLSPKQGEKIEQSGIIEGDLKYFLEVEGYLNGNGWAPFEAIGGRIQLLDENNNVLAVSNIEIIDNWMKIPVYFKVYLFFDPKESKKGTLFFKNDNASGLEENERTFSLDINF